MGNGRERGREEGREERKEGGNQKNNTCTHKHNTNGPSRDVLSTTAPYPPALHPTDEQQCPAPAHAHAFTSHKSCIYHRLRVLGDAA